MRIAIDARALSWAGVGRYVRNLLVGLNEISTEDQFLVLIGKQDKKIFRRLQAKLNADRFKVVIVEGSYYTWREQAMFWWQLNRVEADLWHFPNFNVPLLFNKPYVVTVHDITRFIFSGQTSQSFVKQIIYEQVFKHAVEGARAVICVSEATKQELVKLPIRTRGMVETIYEGVESGFQQAKDQEQSRLVRAMIGGDFPYLLYVGVWMNHKNLPRLLAAYREIVKKRSEIKLVVTGVAKEGYVDVRSETQRLGFADNQVILTGFVEDDLLPALYAGAEILLFPSLYEGFGLPALEAAAVGTPVVVSNVSSFPEIMGEAAVYVNPERVEDIVRGINRLLEGRQYYEQMSVKGLARSRDFTWEKCAKETMRVYEAVNRSRK